MPQDRTIIFQLAMDSEGFVTEEKWQTSASAFFPQAAHIKKVGRKNGRRTHVAEEQML